jgi:tetraacyldisaccharide 4'-kinase
MKGLRQIQRPLLLPFSFFYWIGVSVRNRLFDLSILRSTSFAIPVISVGNITVGGTGKTPHVEMLVRMFKSDYRIAVLSRGYKRKSTGFMMASRHSLVSDIGDEPMQIKNKFPEISVAVDSDRVHGVNKLLKSKHRPELVILDDAFQHRHIRPGFSIVLVDYNRPVFNDILLPAGNLREPWKNISRSQMVIVTKCPENLFPGEMTWFAQKLGLADEQELFFTTYSYGTPEAVFPVKKGKDVPTFKQLRKSHAGILVVSGIANPQPVLQFLQKIVKVHEKMFFADHHEFTNFDVQNISGRFHLIPAHEKYIIVTEKDAVKLRELDMDEQLRKVFLFVPIEVQFLSRGDKSFHRQINKYVKRILAQGI